MFFDGCNFRGICGNGLEMRSGKKKEEGNSRITWQKNGNTVFLQGFLSI